MLNEKVSEIVKSCIGDFNEMSDVQIVVNDSGVYPLYGQGAEMSSVDLVTLLTLVEDAIGESFDTEYEFDTDRALSLEESPFTDSAKLVTFIQTQLVELKLAEEL